MKKILVLMLCMMVVLASMPILPVYATNSLTVDCGSTLRGVTHCASGSLYGLTETKPADITNLVAPLKPNVFTNPARAGSGYQQPIGAAIPTAGRITGTTGKVMIRLADIFPGWPYQFTNMTDWLNKVNSVITDKKNSGYSNFYGYEIWNEPDGTWNTANGTFNNLWLQTYNTIRSNDPGAKIIGPSYSYYNSSSLNSFLSFCKTNNCLPDIVCWHELSGGVQYVSGHIADYRAIEASLGISQRLISINEYCDPDHNLEGQPGSSARYIAKFERAKVDSACITWWFVPYPGRLGSLLATDTQKGAGWYFYKWYGDMTGNMVSVTPPNDASNLVDGAACVDSGAKYISFIFGGPNDGTISTTFKNIPSFIGSTASVKVERVDWTSKDTVCNGTTTVSTSNYTVSNGQITVTLTGCNNSSGYRIYITPGTGSSTPTPTPTPGSSTPTPTPGGIQSGHVYKLNNVNSGKVLGINGMSTSDGANAVQWTDNGTADHEWTVTLLSDGYYKLTNVNSGKVLGISGMSTSDGANAIQWTDSGTADHEWQLVSVSSGVYKLVNKNSGKVLGINGMSTSDGANALQWGDTGTADHNWTLVYVR